jgi:cytoskeletal protein RodZ
MDMSTEHGEDLKNIEPINAIEENEVPEEEVESTLTIGEVLKNAREEKNLSLKVISQHTKISTTMLEHLEENRFNDLPSKAYVIGFVKSYSKTVGLSESDCLQLLNDAYGVTPTEVIKTTDVIPPRSEEPSTSENTSTEIPSQYLTIAGVFVALIIVVAIAINSNNESAKEELAAKTEEKVDEAVHTPLVNVKPQEVSEATPLKEEKVVKKAEEVKPAQETKPVEEKKEAPTETVKKEEVKEVKEKKEEKVVEKKKEVKKKEVKLRALSLPLYSISNDKELMTHLPEKFKQSVIAGKQNVFINAVDGDTWITYKSDDNAIKKFVLKQGRTLLIRGDLIRIFLGNINVAKVFLNNKPLKISSRSGVKSLVFPQEQASDYKLPLFIYENGKAITSSEYEESL